MYLLAILLPADLPVHAYNPDIVVGIMLRFCQVITDNIAADAQADKKQLGRSVNTEKSFTTDREGRHDLEV